MDTILLLKIEKVAFASQFTRGSGRLSLKVQKDKLQGPKQLHTWTFVNYPIKTSTFNLSHSTTQFQGNHQMCYLNSVCA